jgi:general secretion pathway protein G
MSNVMKNRRDATRGLFRHAIVRARRAGEASRRIRSCGFTLLELLVVMVIIGLLAGYVAPRYFSQVGRSEVKAAMAQINSFEKALDQYRLDVGRYPTTEQGLDALVVKPANEPKWQGPYLAKNVPPDPWGRPYQYKFPGEKSEFDLLSYGRDGQPGGTGEGADITNN